MQKRAILKNNSVLRYAEYTCAPVVLNLEMNLTYRGLCKGWNWPHFCPQRVLTTARWWLSMSDIREGELAAQEKMGLFDRLANLLGLRKKEVNVLVVGLNNSGKSTVINNFKREDDRCIDIVPTVGFNVEKFACKLNSEQRWNTPKMPDSSTFNVAFTYLLLHLRKFFSTIHMCIIWDSS